MKQGAKRAYILLITLIVMAAISILSVTTTALIYRYYHMTDARLEALAAAVYDGGNAP